MAIQVRRGLKKDFDPKKMLPGEWAVSIDNDTQNQIVWMCFAAGVVKRMGTYEDFVAQVAEATADVRDEYKTEFDEIKKQIDATAETVQSNKDTVVTISNSIVNTYLPQIEAFVARAETGATGAEKSATDAGNWAKQAESFAHGGTEVREEEDTDNAKYYYEQAKRISQGLSGALLPMGTIPYASLATADKSPGYMYNISGAFTTDDTFKEGAGHHYPAGTNVYLTIDEYWDCLAGYQVVSVNGRTGAVALTKEDVGLGEVDNTPDNQKSVLYAETAGTANDPTKLPLTGGSVSGRIYGNVSAAHLYSSSDEAEYGYYKIAINVYTDIMLAFTVRIYHNYRFIDIVISGYNYLSTGNWESPKATIESSSDNEIVNVFFGKDEDSHLWVAIPARRYSGVDIFNVTDALYGSLVFDFSKLFTITRVNSIEQEKIFKTVTAYPPLLANQITIPHQFTRTLSPDSWQNNAFPYLYTIDIPGLTAMQDVYVGPDMKLTEKQIEAFSNACITGYEQKTGQIILQAVSKPDVELPIVIITGGEPIND